MEQLHDEVTVVGGSLVGDDNDWFDVEHNATMLLEGGEQSGTDDACVRVVTRCTEESYTLESIVG